MIPARTTNGFIAPPPLDEVGINVGFARAVIGDKVDGELWVDRAASPRAAHALHPYGMSLLWGDALDEALEPVLDHLRAGRYRNRDEWLQVDPRWQALDWDALLDAVTAEAATESGGHRPVRYSRVNFTFDPARFLALHPSDAIPAGALARRATAPDFELAGSVVPKFFWRDAAQFLAHGGGWCIERDGAVGAIAFSSFRFDHELELGIETMPASRRQGLALAVATVMIRDLVAAGLTPVWSCRKENTASYELALRLGFQATKIIPYYRLPAMR